MSKIVIALTLLLQATLAWSGQRHILVLHSYDMSYSWTQKLHDGITEAFRELPNGFDVHVEYMDAKRYRNDNYEEQVANWFAKKYQGMNFSAVLTTDDDAFNFFMKYHSKLFPEAALFFCGKGTFDESLLKSHPRPIRGIIEYMDMVSNIKLASRLHGSHKGYFISDASTTGVVQERKWREEFSRYAPEIDMTYLSLKNMTHGELLDYVRQLETGFIILNVIGQDKNGVIIDNLKSTERLAEVAQIPIYAESSIRLGHGVIGGKVKDGFIHGRNTAMKLVRFIRGIDPIPYVDPMDENLLIFDYNILQKFNISIKELPTRAVIINRPVGVYEEYKVWIWSLILLIIMMLLIIAFQTYRMSVKRQFQDELKKLVELRTMELNDQIEEQKRLRHVLISKEKLASLGSLTAGISHELKNPLNIIINSAQIIESRLAETQFEDKPFQDIKKMTQFIIKNGLRADSIIQNMLGQVRSNTTDFEKTSINSLTDEAISLVYHSSLPKYGINIQLSKELNPIPECYVSKQNILRVMINLLENSFYALAMKQKQFGETYVPLLEIKTGQNGDRLFFEIKDNGTGISQATMDKMWHPFFTTKPSGDGAGLGLSMVNDIITSHRGEIEAESREGDYTRIRVYLPLRSEPV